jgi:hypothetical protein
VDDRRALLEAVSKSPLVPMLRCDPKYDLHRGGGAKTHLSMGPGKAAPE